MSGAHETGDYPVMTRPRTPQVHELKCWSEFFIAIVDGSKRYEMRNDDRGFAVGDYLYLREWDSTHQCYTGRAAMARVLHLLRGHFELDDLPDVPAATVCMSIDLLESQVVLVRSKK